MQSKQCPGKATYMWACVISIVGQSMPPKTVLNDASAVSLDSINDFFRAVAVTQVHDSADYFIIPSELSDKGFLFSSISESLVLSHLLSFDIRKTTGPDNISARRSVLLLLLY